MISSTLTEHFSQCRNINKRKCSYKSETKSRQEPPPPTLANFPVPFSKQRPIRTIRGAHRIIIYECDDSPVRTYATVGGKTITRV